MSLIFTHYIEGGEDMANREVFFDENIKRD